MIHFDNCNNLSPFLHVFRSKDSCESQLIGFHQKIFDNLEPDKQTDLIFIVNTVIDFSTAFDKMDHNVFT